MTDDANISLSDRAANRIREIVAQEAGRNALRVSVLGGGCSGFQYSMAFENQSGARRFLFIGAGKRREHDAAHGARKDSEAANCVVRYGVVGHRRTRTHRR